MSNSKPIVKEIETANLLARVVAKPVIGGCMTIGYSLREKEPEDNEFGVGSIFDLPELAAKLAAEIIDIVDAADASRELPDLYNMLHILREQLEGTGDPSV